MKWWGIYRNLPVDDIVRLAHLRSGDSQGQDTFLATSADKSTRKYDIECSKPPSLTINPKGKDIELKQDEMVIHIYKFTSGCHSQSTPPQEWISQDKETFLAPLGDKQTRNYDKECWNRHPSLSTLRPKELSHSKMKWWAIYTNFAVDVIVRLPQPPSGDSQCKQTFLPPSHDKKTRNYDRECSNHHPSLSTLRPKGLSHSKIKWWAIHTNIPVDVKVRISHLRSGNSQHQEIFLGPSAYKQTRNYDIKFSNDHPSL